MTNLDIQTRVSGLIPDIRMSQIELARLNSRLLDAEEELRKSDEFKLVNELKTTIKDFELREKTLREEGRELMIQNGLHDFTTLEGVTVQLNKTPGSLSIGADFKCPEEYFRIKKEIDKAKLKKDFVDGKFYDDNISIDVEYKLVIKEK